MAVTISLSITQNSQSVANNTSNVTVKATVSWTYGSWNATGECTGSLTIDGTKYSFSGLKFNVNTTTSGSQTIMTKTVDVKHADDGTKKLSCSTSFVTGITSGTITASASQTLTTIPRKSSLTVANGTLGTAQTLTISEKASSFKHKLKYVCGDASGWILGGSSSFSTANSVSWTPPLSLAQENTTGASVSVTFTLYTYTEDGTSVGNNSYTNTFSIPDSVKPTVSLAVSDPTGHKDTYGGYVQGISTIKVVATASGNQGSTIKSYKTEANGKIYTTKEATTSVITNSGTLTIKTTVTDSRGRTATATTTITALAYSPPKISTLNVYRSNSEGVASNSGDHLAVSFDSTITALNDVNSATYTIQYKKTTASAYTTATLTDYADEYAVAGGIFVFSADAASSYDVVLTATDDFKNVKRTAVGSSIKKLWSMLSRGMGFAFGKIAELEDVLDVNFVLRARKGIVVDADWIDLTLSDSFTVYNGTVVNHPKYKVTGNVVTVQGVVSPTAEFTSSTNAVTIASGIPTEFCPRIDSYFVCQGSGMNRWACAVKTSGRVTIERYGITEPTVVPTTAWLTFTVTYQI